MGVKKFFITALAAVAVASVAHAADWPAHPVTFIVPTGASSGSDIVARALSARLQDTWKQPVVVDNRTGASGLIGINAVIRAPADGLTVLFAPNTLSMISAVNKAAADLDVERSLEPIAMIVRLSMALVVSSDLPVQTVEELVAFSKSRPGEINYATPGVGTPHHLSTELFKSVTGADMTHVPYKGVAGAVTDIASGRAQVGIVGLTNVLPFVQSGKMRILAVSGDERISVVPDAPTFQEAGIGQVLAGGWVGVFVPQGTPAAISEKISADIADQLGQPDFQTQLLNASMLPVSPKQAGSAAMASTLKSEVALWKKTVEQLNITLE